MKNIFMLTSKLMGVYVIFQGVVSFAALAAVGAPPLPESQMAMLNAYSWLRFVIPLFIVVCGICLIIFAEELAKQVGASGPIETPEFSSVSFLRVGCAIIGINYLLRVLNGSVTKIMTLFATYPSDSKGFSLGDIVGIVAALFLIFQAGTIASHVEKINKAS